METIAQYTDKQYGQSVTLQCQDNKIYSVLSSVDMHWLMKDEKYVGKYLTTLKLIGTINTTTKQ